jgi:uncharacterized protein YdhG (YjbR/CyaY superfamily)
MGPQSNTGVDFTTQEDQKCEIMAKRKNLKQTGAIGVDEYIANTPKDVQSRLKKIRAAIRDAAPGATERTDYVQFPGYSYEGYDYDGMFVWFSFKKPHIRLHLRPPVIQDHKKELADCTTTKAIVSFPSVKDISIALAKKARESEPEGDEGQIQVTYFRRVHSASLARNPAITR